MGAIEAGHKDMVRQMLNKFSPNSQCKIGRTPLHFAMVSQNLECIQMVLKAGADPNTPMGDGGAPLIYAIEKRSRAAITLLDHKADPNVCNKERSASALHLAAQCDLPGSFFLFNVSFFVE